MKLKAIMYTLGYGKNKKALVRSEGARRVKQAEVMMQGRKRLKQISFPFRYGCSTANLRDVIAEGEIDKMKLIMAGYNVIN